jgi:hypothetical protein
LEPPHGGREQFGVAFLLALSLAHPADQAETSHTSLAVWVAVAVVLAIVVFGGLVLASRR